MVKAQSVVPKPNVRGHASQAPARAGRCLVGPNPDFPLVEFLGVDYDPCSSIFPFGETGNLELGPICAIESVGPGNLRDCSHDQGSCVSGLHRGPV